MEKRKRSLTIQNLFEVFSFLSPYKRKKLYNSIGNKNYYLQQYNFLQHTLKNEKSSLIIQAYNTRRDYAIFWFLYSAFSTYKIENLMSLKIKIGHNFSDELGIITLADILEKLNLLLINLMAHNLNLICIGKMDLLSKQIQMKI